MEDVKIQDLSAQFYLTKADVGKNRAEACREKLQELNTAVAVSASSAELNEDLLSKFQVQRSFQLLIIACVQLAIIMLDFMQVVHDLSKCRRCCTKDTYIKGSYEGCLGAADLQISGRLWLP